MSLKPPAAANPGVTDIVGRYEDGDFPLWDGDSFEPQSRHQIQRRTYGSRDSATVFSLIADREYGPTVEVAGATHPSLTGERAHVAFYGDAKARQGTVDSSSTTFTASSVTFGGAVDVSSVLAGMFVDINPPASGAPTSAVGVVQSVSGQRVNVDGWYVNSAGTATVTATPSNGTRAVVNFTRKTWFANFAVYKTATQGNLNAQVAVGEVDLFTANDDSQATLDAEGVYSWGWDVYMGGTGHATSGFTVRGSLKTQFGYLATGISKGTTGGDYSAHFMACQGYGMTGGTVQGAFMDDLSAATVSFRANSASRSKVMLGGFADHANATKRYFSATVDGTLEWSNDAATTPDVKLENEVVGGNETGNLLVSTGGLKVSSTAPIRLTSGGAIELSERADTGAASADKAFLYIRDNGSGKTQFVAQFPTGAVQVIATQP